MLEQLLPVLILTLVVIFFVILMLTATFFAGPKRKPTPRKQIPYECGIEGEPAKSTKFPVKFYLTAILFILFDIEVIFLYPWALIYSDGLTKGSFVFFEMVAFVLILSFGLFYVWKANALEWD